VNSTRNLSTKESFFTDTAVGDDLLYPVLRRVNGSSLVNEESEMSRFRDSYPLLWGFVP
jgi:hypothetical protein